MMEYKDKKKVTRYYNNNNVIVFRAVVRVFIFQAFF